MDDLPAVVVETQEIKVLLDVIYEAKPCFRSHNFDKGNIDSTMRHIVGNIVCHTYGSSAVLHLATMLHKAIVSIRHLFERLVVIANRRNDTLQLRDCTRVLARWPQPHTICQTCINVWLVEGNPIVNILAQVHHHLSVEFLEERLDPARCPAAHAVCPWRQRVMEKSEHHLKPRCFYLLANFHISAHGRSIKKFRSWEESEPINSHTQHLHIGLHGEVNLNIWLRPKTQAILRVRCVFPAGHMPISSELNPIVFQLILGLRWSSG
mmetsp:Transcript_70555/g.169044  ORF Transcript_70555/g.169044 Transcript_70555/m.169044 type:complete len:265 (+) Transcript_70555:736-1530(+)